MPTDPYADLPKVTQIYPRAAADESATPNSRATQRSRIVRRGHRRRLSGPYHRAMKKARRGRFFRAKTDLIEYRKEFSPEDLGFADWLVFRRPANPYRPGSRADKRYKAAYEQSKRDRPNPEFPRLA